MPSIDITFNNQVERSLPLNKDTFVIGRQEGCDIHIDNLGVSRNHAQIVQAGQGFCIEDMNSSNGTFVNGNPVKRHDLQEGDEIAIGKYVLIYRASGEAAPAAAPAEDISASAGGLPDDALNTMAMDGDVIRKRLEAMHAQKTEEEAGSQQAKPAMSHKERSNANTNVLSAAEMRARQKEKEMIESSGGKIKIIVLAITVLALVGVIYYFFGR